MLTFVPVLWPEILLVVTACALFLLGVSSKAASRRLAPVLSLTALGAVFFVHLFQSSRGLSEDYMHTLQVGGLADFVKLLASGVGMLLVLLAWPTNSDATGNAALNFGQEAGEFFALMLLSIAGVFLVSGANDIILLFLGIELASIPTYIMVSISRPLAVAQEAGVKYFFLGAMAAALMLFGFSYLYGTTGLIHLDDIGALISRSGGLTSWQLLAVVMLLAGFAFKIAAVPLHAYAGDVYQGAATPVTAFLAFVPKTSGFIALIKVLTVVHGPHWSAPDSVVGLLWVMAVLTMTFGNVLGLLQYNIKRVLAYSSVAHSGYMLVGLTALVSTTNAHVQNEALRGVLFYLAAYGIMNSGVFGVLMMLPARSSDPGRSGRGFAPSAASAETFEDIAGQGRRHLWLGLAMAVGCFSLTGLPLTIGFFGKVLLIKPALDAGSVNPAVSTPMGWLVGLTMLNAAISAGYYLRIVAAMFLRPEQAAEAQALDDEGLAGFRAAPLALSVVLSVGATLVFGTIYPMTTGLTRRVADAAGPEPRPAPILSDVTQVDSR